MIQKHEEIYDDIIVPNDVILKDDDLNLCDLYDLIFNN